jgi:mannose-6-phosphate isomerase-like protein (cupin superfamily)
VEIVNMKSVSKTSLGGSHGGALFQRVLGRGTSTLGLMRSIQGVSRITVPPGESNEVHVHEAEEQIYVVLRGRGEVQVGEEVRGAEPGDVVYLPAGVPHGFRNTSKGDCVLLNVGARV